MAAGAASLILCNANIIPGGSCELRKGAIATRGERILALAADEDVAQLKGPTTRVIDCRGKTLVPGFIDAHCHFFSLVRKLLSLDLSPAFVRSIEDIKDIIRRRTKSMSAGRWIVGTGYNEFYLAEKRHPTRRDLDEAALDHPVIIYHRSLHACVLSSLALKLAGIDNETEEPPGGVIERDLDTGEPNGVLFEMADFVRSRMPPLFSEEHLEHGIAEANRHYLSLGITSIGEATAGNGIGQWQIYQKLKQTGKLKSRIYMMSGADALAEFRKSGLATGSGNRHLRLGSAKIVLSQARGYLQPPQKELNNVVLESINMGFQTAIHAIERSAVEAAITALEFAGTKRRNQFLQKQYPACGRHRIEHCSECPPELISRLRRLQAVVVSQPPFIYYSGERYLSQVSEDAQQWLYPFKSMMNAGLNLSASSDSPIVPDNPLTGIYGAVTRLAESGRRVLPAEAISASRAIDMYTVNAAYASFEEQEKGSLSPGKLADIVLLGAQPLETPAEQLKDIRVEMTILGGEVVWEKGM
jgi:predicted amidohydrolase YtcJ